MALIHNNRTQYSLLAYARVTTTFDFFNITFWLIGVDFDLHRNLVLMIETKVLKLKYGIKLNFLDYYFMLNSRAVSK